MRFRFNNSFALHEGAFVFVILMVMEVIWFSYATYSEETAIFTLTFSVTEQRGVRVGGVGCTQSYWLHGTYFFGLSCTLH